MEKKNVKCVGNGNVKDLEKKSIKEKLDVLEVNNIREITNKNIMKFYDWKKWSGDYDLRRQEISKFFGNESIQTGNLLKKGR